MHGLIVSPAYCYCLAAVTFDFIYCFHKLILLHFIPAQSWEVFQSHVITSFMKQHFWNISVDIRDKVFFELILTCSALCIALILVCILIILKYNKIHMYSLRSFTVFLEVNCSHQMGSRWILEFSPILPNIFLLLF